MTLRQPKPQRIAILGNLEDIYPPLDSFSNIKKFRDFCLY
jgi:hypothetical protein